MNNLFQVLILIICIIVRHETNGTPTRREKYSSRQLISSINRDSVIRFPGEKFKYVIPTNCESTLCENVDEYETDHVDLLVMKSANKHEHLHQIDSLIPDVMIDDRFNLNDEERPLCGTIERVIYPRVGQTSNKDWMVLVNTGNFKQGVRVEQCIHNGRCEMTSSFPLGYETKCKQKYIYRQLLAVSTDGTGTVKELFKIPSCCQCVLITKFT